MKACPERALLLQGLREEEAAAEEEDGDGGGGAFEGLKQEEEVEDEHGPFVVVKLEEEQAACSARCGGSGGAAEAKMELELSLFAPVESDEEEQQRLQQRSLADSGSGAAGAPVWRNRGARERAGQTEGAEFPQKRPRGRPRRQKKALGRRGRPRKVAAGGESRMEVILEADEEEEPREHAPPQKRARSMCWDFSPTKVSHSGVWEHFEYFINPDGEVEDDGFPTCKICQQKVACKRGNTSNMLRHLQDYHTAAYYKAKKVDAVWTEWDSSDSDREMKMEEDVEDMEKQWHSEEEKYDVDADDDDVDYTDRRYPKSPRQKRQVRSAVWQYFVYSNDDDANKERVASCKICGWKVSPGSSCNTSNMRYHLQAHHQIVCPVTKPGIPTSIDIPLAEGEDQLKLFPPKNPRKSGVWKLFGFVMNTEGVVEENGFPICRLCHQVVASKDGNTSNMHSHLQRHHQTVYAELKHIIGSVRPEHRLSEPAEIHPPVKHRNSPVWKYFGFVKNAEGMVKEDGFALCRLCLRKVAAKDGTTSNMLNHLRRHHQAEYEEVKLATDALPLGSADDGSDLPELFPPTRLPLSPVWDYFGYPKNADGVIEENEHPKCKACRRSIISRQGILSNMLRHLKFHHNSLFAELKLKTGAPRQYKERIRPPPIQATPEELHPPKIALKSAVWKYFGYLKNSDGVVVPDGFPVCKLCLRKVSTQRGSTTNMMVHLQNYHQTEFAEMKLSGEENETGEDGEIPGQAENTDQQSKLFPPRDLLEPVWEHFGYQKDADGTVQVDGHPLCKICGSKVSCEGENTQFLYRHLWKKHKSVYYEVKVATNCLREEDGHTPPALYPPTQRVKSVVWEYFGYLKDANGTVVCDGFPICKICQLNVAAKGGNTTNLFKHLQDHHKAVYEEIRPGFSDEVIAGAGTSSSSSELSAPNAQINSKLWDYFENPKNADGTSVEEGPPICKICDQTLDSSGDTTSNMMKHLQESHEMVYAEVQAAIVPPRAEDGLEAPDLHPPTQNLLSRVWEYFGFLKDTGGSVVFDGYPICRMCQQRVEAKGGDTTNMFLHLKAHHLQIYKEIKPATEKKIYKASELSPPNGEIDSRLWDHFGYPKNADGVIEDDGAPVCKLCLQKLTTASKSATISSNMMRHLRKKHELVYNEVQEALTALRAEGGNDSAELHPPTQNVTSPVWEYFGYLKDAEGLVVSDGFPICKMCQKKVASKGGNTTNMFKHLKDYHRTIYDEIRSAVTNETLEDSYTTADLHPPSGQHDSPLWEHFGYRKDAEGILQEDGAPYCKICLRKLISKGETTRNMRQHLKENHSSVYTEPEEVVSSFTWEADMDSSNLCPPTHKVKSAVWKFFGYPKDAEGSVVCNGFPICKLCQKKVSAKGGNTTNMFSHLRDYHRPTYDEIKAVVIPARAETDLEPLELHLPTADAMSPVWKYFGYPKNSDGTILCDGFPICRICQKKVLAKGDNTTNMLIHLRAYHLDIYKEVKSAVAKKVVYRPFELFPPNSQNDIKLWDHFGYPKNADGVLQDDGAPICKICLRKLMKASGDGTPTTNMLRHLRKKHQSVFDEVQEAITALRTEWGIEPPELHPPTQNVTSPVWEYFGYLKDAEGSVVCDDYPICKLCQQKVASKGRCTTNMFKHLKDYHRVTYDEIRSAVTNETFEDVCMPTDLHPPSGPYNPKLWEYFGYRKTDEGIVDEDGAPICKLCFRKLISKGETTANMMQHLKENHNAVYADVQREVNPFTIGGATELPDLHPPEHRVRSAVWKYFGYLRDTEGPADCAGYPICKICLSKVSNKGKVTANMTAHLKDHHKDFYDDLKIPEKKEKVVSAEELPELFPPNKQPLPPIWEYFGLTKNIDGSVEEDGSPICKICARKVSSQDPRRMIRHLQFCHFAAYEEFKKANRKSKLGLQGGSEPAELCPPSKQVRSFVWEYFGYPKNPDGTVNVDGRPVCKTCFRKVSSQGGNTTNMLKHLEDKHGFKKYKKDRDERSSSVERPRVPVQSGLAEGAAGASAPCAVPHLTSAVSPLAGLEPPLFPAAPGLQERAQGDEREENVLLQVLSHCRFLHGAVQRLEQKIDNLQSNRCVTGGCSKQEIPEEGELRAGQLSWSLAQRLGPSPQTRHHRAPPWKRHPAQPILGAAVPPEPEPYCSRTTRTDGGGRGNSRRRGRWGRWGAGVKRGSQSQQPNSELQPEQELPEKGSFAIKEEPQAAKVPKKVPRLDRRVKKRLVAVSELKAAVDTPPAEEDKQEWLAEMCPQHDLTVRGSAWAQCLGVLNRIPKDLRQKEGTPPRAAAE
ncbi:hypothetical protein AOLI_G00153650 [Acnodon oligacanthus]